MSAAAGLRRIWLCADDGGISPGVNRAIRDLIERGLLRHPRPGRISIAASRSCWNCTGIRVAIVLDDVYVLFVC